MSSSKRCCIIAQFDRKVLGMPGAGHWSPLGVYNKDEDKVLVLDTGKKYGHWWVEVPRLFQAMNTINFTSVLPFVYPKLTKLGCIKQDTEGMTRGWVMVKLAEAQADVVEYDQIFYV